MEAFCIKLLGEKDPPILPPPEDRHVRIAVAAFEGKTIGEIRAEYPHTSIKTIGESIRATRDAIRRGQAPDIVKDQFPALIAEQKAYKSGGKTFRQTATGKAAQMISTSLSLVKVTSFRDFIDMAREKFAPIAVPLTMQKIIEGVEGGDPNMIKLSAEVYHLNPRKGGINQQFNFPSGKSESEEKTRSTNPERRALFFEEIVRRQRARIDGAAPAATVDVEVQEPDESGDDED